ncbi:MAG: HAMP domain-containing sensor histidine kinase, partial [Longimicrobiales bacterium]|nr:HAMP domain-containing sensor histidine kinase [Longimicrobiales bacterium]
MKVSLKSALMGLVVMVLLVGLIPAGLLLDRRLVDALEEDVRLDLATAPLVLRDRFGNQASARMMHAREMALDPTLGAALADGDAEVAVDRAVEIAGSFPGETAVVVAGDGALLAGPAIPSHIVDSTRAGVSPTLVTQTPEGPGTVALAPVGSGEAWSGAVGVWVPMTADEAAQLSALTRSDVLLRAPDGELAGYTGRAEPAMGLFSLLEELPVREDVQELELSGTRYLVASARLPGGARVSFVRSLEEELAVVPQLRAVALGALGVGLLLALAVGVGFAARLARPVGSLAGAATRLSRGDFDAPVEPSSVTEVDQTARAFEVMRDALASRIDELAEANRALEDRQERLAMLQAELVQRDRLSAASRLLTQLAHEIRNPVASVRNCLEVLRRRVDDDEEASELADLAIDELLRMHELAEQMLDLHRPRSGEGHCDAVSVAQDVASVVRVGMGDRSIEIAVDTPEEAQAEIPADALKQVLLNLVQNAQDALGDEGSIGIRVTCSENNVRIDVVDSGPGIEDDALPRIFDPFFTTKADVRGVGLGLFTAAGIVRGHGGRIAASNRADARGARITVEVPRATSVPSE